MVYFLFQHYKKTHMSVTFFIVFLITLPDDLYPDQARQERRACSGSKVFGTLTVFLDGLFFIIIILKTKNSMEREIQHLALKL